MFKWVSFKIMFERTKMYVAWVQFAMIGWLFVLQTGFNLLSTLALTGALLGMLALIDFRWILPAEMERLAEKNPVLMSIRDNIEELLELEKQRYEREEK